MPVVNPVTYKKFGLMLISLVLLFIFRQDAWLAGLRVNRTLLIFNQYPVWRAIVSDTLPDTLLLLSSDESTADDRLLAQGHGLLLFVRGREAEAVTVWQTAGLSPAEVTAVQGYYARTVNHPQAALAWYERTVELDPTLASAWQALGELYQQEGETAAAKAAYERAFVLGDATSADPLARLWRDEGDHEVAISIWQSALESHPADLERLRWWRGLSESLRAIEQWNTCVQVTKIALDEFPYDARLYVERGYALYYAHEDLSGSLESLQQAIALDDEMAMAYAAMGHILIRENNYSDAIIWYTKAIDRDSSNRSWHLSRAIAVRASGNTGQSLQLFQEIIDRYPDWHLAHYQIALAHHQSGNTDEAVIAIEHALTLLDLPNPQYLARAGIIYESKGEPDRARDFFTQALLLDPDNEVAEQGINRLGKD